MAGKLSFSIAINFLTENFKKGTNQIKAGFQAMQAQILTFAAALGAGGIGLSNLVTKFIEVAKSTNRVTTALKNVSGSMAVFADNQRYLLDLAKKYGLEINALTGNYAKFTAAASISGMSMQEQRKIFESLSRAATAFGMSADDSNGVFLALSQMMSKGKISSEELRLQMGERLPIALQAMAKAAGTSVAGLDRLMKEGKLLSAEVLPKFADALNEMIPNVDTDNLETSLNRLQNVFTKLVNETDIQGKYKGLIDWLTGYVKKATDNIQSVITYVVAAIAVLVTSRLVNKLIVSFQKTELAAKAAARRAAKAAGQSFDEVAWRSQKASSTMKAMFSNAAKSVKAALISMVPTAIIAVIGAVVAKLVVMAQEAKRIKNLFSEYKAELNKSTNTSDIINLQTQYKIATDLKRNLDERRSALSQINRQLNTNYSIDEKNLTIQGDLNKKFAERVELLKAAAEVDYLTQKKLEVEDNIESIQRKKGARKEEVASGNANAFSVLWQGVTKIASDKFKIGTGSDIQTYDTELVEQNRILKDINARLEQATVKANSSSVGLSTAGTGNIVGPGSNDKKTPLQKLEEKSAKELSELEAKFKIGSLSQTEYNKALAELNIKLYAEASGSNDRKVLESEFYKVRQEAARQAVDQMGQFKAAIELEKIQKEYSASLEKLKAQKENGILTEEQYKSELQRLAVETARTAGAIKDIGIEGKAFVAAMQATAQTMSTPVKVKERDTTFDYKKNAVDIASEKLDLAKEYAKDLQEEFQKAGKTLDDELAKSMAGVPDLEQALKIAQVRQDIKDLSKELREGIYSGVKNIASSADRMVNAFSQMQDVLGDEDATAWEKVMAVWNTMINTVDSIMSVVQTIENISEVAKKLSGAKEENASAEEEALGIIGTKAAEVAANEAAAAIEIATSKAKTQAATTEMAAKSTAAYASIPFAGVGLASGQIAAMQSLITAASNVPQFANGGIVSGRTLAEVGEYPGASSNPEVIAPLSKLKDMIGGGSVSRIKVEVGGRAVIRGSDAWLQISNHAKKIGKKFP
jgi:tape measure domain-containing protein